MTRDLAETFSPLFVETIRGDALRRYSLGELAPQIALRPKTLEEISAILRLANEKRAATVLWGAGTKLPWGKPPISYGLALDMTGLDQVVSHDKDNFTITAQAGLSLGALQEILKPADQFFPLNPPQGDTATLGGLTAANNSGPWRLAYGSLRDLILGIKVVLPDGNIVSFGGKTMKNVAGYDVGKLFIGSQGTLGAIVEMTLRLFALPEKRATLLLPSNSLPEAFDLANRAIALPATAAQIIDPVTAKRVFEKVSWLTAIDLLGDEEVVEGQLRVIASPGASPLENDSRQKCWDTIGGLTRPGSSEILGRAVLPPAALKGWVEQITADNRPDRFVLCPGTGRAWVAFSADESSAEKITSLRLLANHLGGYCTLDAARQNRQLSLLMGDIKDADLALFMGVKQVFDPNHILAPGSYLGGI